MCIWSTDFWQECQEHAMEEKSTQNELVPNMGPETIKLLEENIYKKLLDITLGNDLSDMTLKACT